MDNLILILFAMLVSLLPAITIGCFVKVTIDEDCSRQNRDKSILEKTIVFSSFITPYIIMLWNLLSKHYS